MVWDVGEAGLDYGLELLVCVAGECDACKAEATADFVA